MVFDSNSESLTKYNLQTNTQFSKTSKSTSSCYVSEAYEENKVSCNFNMSNSDFNEMQSQINNFSKGTLKNMLQTKNAINNYDLSNDIDISQTE